MFRVVPQRQPALIAIVIVAAIVARLLMVTVLDPLNWQPGDDVYYIAVARSLVEHGTYAFQGDLSNYRTPGYPIFLAMLSLVSSSPLLIFAAQSLLTVAAAVLALLRLPRHGLVTALLIVTSPFLVVHEWKVLSEGLFIPLLWAGILLIMFPKRRVEPIIGGGLIGFSILVRDALILLPLFLIAAAVMRRELMKPAIIAALAAYLIILPWPIRNATLPEGHFAMGEGRVGFNLWVGTWERNGDWFRTGIVNGAYPDYAFVSSAQRAALIPQLGKPDETPFKNAALARMKTDPLFVLTSWVVRYPKLWLSTRTEQAKLRLERGSTAWTVFKASLFALNALVVAVGLIGIALSFRNRALMLAVPIAYLALIHVPFHNTEARYSLPAIPFLCYFAAVAMAWAVERFRLGRDRVNDHDVERDHLGKCGDGLIADPGPA